MTRRVRIKPISVGRFTPTEVCNILYPGQVAKSGITAERYAVHGHNLPAHHVAHYVYGDADAKRRFEAACASRRLARIKAGEV